MYLSKIYIKNFRGIKELLVEFDKKLNVIIGANGQLKTSLMDAIRLFYVWGEPNRDIEITKEDFYVEFTQNPDGTKVATTSTRIDICYLFEGLSAQQEGAFYQYLDRKDDGSMVARVHLSFEIKEKGRIYSSYITGKEENGLRADWNTFHYFHPYYLGALRDSTRDLMSSRNNLLGKVIKRKIDTTQFIISNPFRSETMVGIAVETIVPSTPDIKVVIKIASVTSDTFVFFIFTPSFYYLLFLM